MGVRRSALETAAAARGFHSNTFPTGGWIRRAATRPVDSAAISGANPSVASTRRQYVGAPRLPWPYHFAFDLSQLLLFRLKPSRRAVQARRIAFECKNRCAMVIAWRGFLCPPDVCRRQYECLVCKA